MILTILKIIGFILLAIVLIVVACIILVLFVPIRYRVKADFDKSNIEVQADASWLLHAVAINASFLENHLQAYFRILFLKKKLLSDEINEENQDDKSSAHSSTEGNVNEENTLIEDDEVEEFRDDLKDEKYDAGVKIDSESDIKPNSEEFTQSTEIESDTEKPSKIDKGKRILKKTDALFKKLKKIKDIVSNEKNKLAIEHLKKESFLLLRRICPKKLKLDASFSTGAPDTTGIVLGVLSMFPIGYVNRWNISPNFESENFYVDGELDAKGNIFVISLLGILIRIIFDKNCRKLYNDFMD